MWVTQSCPVICDPWTVAHQVLCPENFPGKNIGVGSHSFLEGIFLAWGSNPGLLDCRQILYYMNHQRTLTLVDMDVKILKRILANQIDEYIKESYTMIKCKSFCAFKHDLVSVHQSLWYTIWAKLRIKSHDLRNNCRKSFWQRETSILIQSLNTVVIHETC